MSPKSLSLMFGNGTVDTTSGSFIKVDNYIATAADVTAIPTKATFVFNGTEYESTAIKFYDEEGELVTLMVAGEQYLREATYATANMRTIKIDANTFPGTYRITGQTYIRAQDGGRDSFFEFDIPQAKMSAEQTITMEAAGDPSVFNLTMRVLRPSTGSMMEFRMFDPA